MQPKTLTLATLGHATLVVLEDGRPILATDPWIVGSAYWSSWWLERYPVDEEKNLVLQANNIYVTHSHPDHFHYPSLRLLGPRTVLHPRFPRYTAPGFLENEGFSTQILEPWTWYQLSDQVKIASIPVPIDDSVLIVDTPGATIIDVNDANPHGGLLRSIRKRMFTAGKPVLVLKSYAPASSAVATFKNGQRSPLKSKRDYVLAAERIANRLGAQGFVPFASQAFFGRSDSTWANEYKVTYEDLLRYWSDPRVVLYPPFLKMDLASLDYETSYGDVNRTLDDTQKLEVKCREEEEAAFELPADFDDLLKRYFDDVYFIRLLYRHGIGFRLTSSGKERFYNCRTRAVDLEIPERCDFTIGLPDKVLYDSLRNGVLTDLGITMFIHIDTRTSLRMTYAAFLLMGLHDYGHFDTSLSFARFVMFYIPYVVPQVFVPKRGRERRAAICLGPRS